MRAKSKPQPFFKQKSFAMEHQNPTDPPMEKPGAESDPGPLWKVIHYKNQMICEHHWVTFYKQVQKWSVFNLILQNFQPKSLWLAMKYIYITWMHFSHMIHSSLLCTTCMFFPFQTDWAQNFQTLTVWLFISVGCEANPGKSPRLIYMHDTSSSQRPPYIWTHSEYFL